MDEVEDLAFCSASPGLSGRFGFASRPVLWPAPIKLFPFVGCRYWRRGNARSKSAVSFVATCGNFTGSVISNRMMRREPGPFP